VLKSTDIYPPTLGFFDHHWKASETIGRPTIDRPDSRPIALIPQRSGAAVCRPKRDAISAHASRKDQSGARSLAAK